MMIYVLFFKGGLPAWHSLEKGGWVLFPWVLEDEVKYWVVILQDLEDEVNYTPED